LDKKQKEPIITLFSLFTFLLQRLLRICLTCNIKKKYWMLKKFLVKIAVPLNCFNKKLLCRFDLERQKVKSEKVS